MQRGTTAAAGSSGGPTTQSSPDNAKQEEDTKTEATDIKTEKALVKKAPASKKTTSKRKATSPAASTETAKSNGRASSKPKVAKKLPVSTPSASIREESSDTDPSSDNSPKIIKEESGKGKDTDSSPSPADPSPKKVIESTVEDDDNELEGNVFARMDLLSGHSFKTDKAVAEEEERVATPPTAEEIQLATSVLGSLLEGDPAAFYQDRRMEEILSSARILARNPELPKNKCKFWHEFPKIFQDFVKCFAEKEKAAEATATANKNVKDGFTLLSNKKEEYKRVKESQLTECQKLEEELAQLEARVSDLKTLISVKQKEMKTRRKQLLDALNHLLKKQELEKAAAEALAKMNEGIPRELTNMQLQWKEWRKFL